MRGLRKRKVGACSPDFMILGVVCQVIFNHEVFIKIAHETGIVFILCKPLAQFHKICKHVQDAGMQTRITLELLETASQQTAGT